MQSEYRMVCIGVYEWFRDACTVDVAMCSVCACVCVQGKCSREEAEEEGCRQMVKDFIYDMPQNWDFALHDLGSHSMFDTRG